MSDLITTDLVELRRGLSALFSAETAQGEPLFPDHNLPGSPGYNFKQIMAEALAGQGREISAVLRSQSPRTAQGGALDAWLNYFGMNRSPEAAGSGVVEATAEQNGNVLAQLLGTRQIDAGTRLATGSLALVLEEPLTFEDGTNVASARARLVEQGRELNEGTEVVIAGNHPLSNVVQMTTTTSFGKGSSTDTDEQARYRLALALRRPGTTGALEEAFLGHAEVSDVQFFPGVYGPGTVEVFVLPTAALPSIQLREQLEELYVGPGRAFVIFPEYEAIGLKIRCVGSDEATLQKAAADYISQISSGNPFVISQLERAILNAGASDVQIVELRRGMVSPSGRAIGVIPLATTTNLTAKSSKHKWYTNPSWVTICR